MAGRKLLPGTKHPSREGTYHSSPPTKKGWYWCRNVHDDGMVAGEWGIAYRDPVTGFHVVGGGVYSPYDEIVIAAEWLGPLQPPNNLDTFEDTLLDEDQDWES